MYSAKTAKEEADLVNKNYNLKCILQDIETKAKSGVYSCVFSFEKISYYSKMCNQKTVQVLLTLGYRVVKFFDKAEEVDAVFISWD